jgi:5-methylcytosine-specific restriction endonuclease McrA
MLKPCAEPGCTALSPLPRCPAHTARNGSTRRWRKVRVQVLERDGHRCRYCGASANTVDHVTPLIVGGSDHDTNLVAACDHCNKTKGATA